MMSTLSYSYVALSILILGGPRKIEASLDKTCSPEKLREGPSSRGMCGTHLSNTIGMVCSIGFPMRKRDEMSAVPSLKSVIANKMEAMDYLSKRNGFGRRGVVCECCYHQCSMAELQEYCVTNKRSLQLPSKTLAAPGNQGGMIAQDQWLP